MAHRHKAIEGERKTYGFDGCVAGSRCNPASHGGVRHVDKCTCGAVRYTNSTGFGRDERGPWIARNAK